MKQFVTATPEEVGISSERIVRFMKTLEYNEIPMHSLLIIRYGKLVAESYYAPYTKDTLHRMFSVTKSFTSIAIGLLAEEGKLSLDDNIISYFPEMLSETGVHPYIAEMTIKDMLKMASAHENTTYKIDIKEDWVKSFFITEPSHYPGTIFSYDTSSSHTLAALVEKISGMKMLDYLRSKFLDELEFSKDAYIISDPNGVSMGGSGLMATPMDFAKVAWTVMHDGRAEDKQLIPEWYIKEATKKQIDTSVKGGTTEEKQGYGYQFWRIRNDGFACYGMGGQLAICIPKEDLLVVTTADTQGLGGGVQVIYDTFWREIYDNLSDKPFVENIEGSKSLKAILKESQIKAVAGDLTNVIVNTINGRTYSFDDENPMNLKNIKIELKEELGIFCFENQNGKQELTFGLGKQIESKFPHYNMNCVSSAAWVEEKTLLIKSHIIDECLGSIQVQVHFKSDREVVVYMKKIEEYLFHEFLGFANGRIED
ncbi:MAG: serine hydrolase [Clostridiales bacterium]|nr:serine hydrolase [Clostridiales bacterium]